MTKTVTKIVMAAACWVGVGIVVACSGGNSNKINCGDGSQECGGACTVIARDSQNCGTCGKACAATELCSAGSCVPASGGCTMGTTKCGNECTNAQNDPRNCGSCGKACAASEVCMAGACASSCGMGTMKCGMSCVDTKNDRTNCGMCGTMCKDGEICTNGTCGISCQQGLSKCNSSSFDAGVPEGGLSGDFCTNLQADNLNCGACGKTCTGSQTCQSGTCADSSLFWAAGVQTNLPVANLKGWKVCYTDLYNVNLPYTTVLNQCQGKFLLMGCFPNNAPSNLQVAAMAPRADVVFATGNTGSGQNKTHVANSVAWYADNNWSWGFANPGDAVSLNECDTATTPNNNLRLCWHTVQAGGYRCGANTNLNSSNAYTRVVYQSP